MWRVTAAWEELFTSRLLCSRPEAPELMRKLVREGNLGPKTGKGFYDWSNKSIQDVKAQRDAFALEFLKSRKRRKTSEASGT
jgi:3-hydroxybutyryl-CoA dehydrogenase